MKITANVIAIMAEAIRSEDGCGCSLDNGVTTVFCDDERLSDHIRRTDGCSCKALARAAFAAIEANGYHINRS